MAAAPPVAPGERHIFETTSTSKCEDDRGVAPRLEIGTGKTKTARTATFGNPAGVCNYSAFVVIFLNKIPVSILFQFWFDFIKAPIYTPNKSTAMNNVNMYIHGSVKVEANNVTKRTRYALGSTQQTCKSRKHRGEKTLVVSNASEALIPAEQNPVELSCL